MAAIHVALLLIGKDNWCEGEHVSCLDSDPLNQGLDLARVEGEAPCPLSGADTSTGCDEQPECAGVQSTRQMCFQVGVHAWC